MNKFMKDSLILQDNNYISAKRVQELFGYTSDYVGQLCRSGKIEAKMIGRSWFVTEKSIINHKLSVNEFLKDKSRERRKLGKKIYKSVAVEPTVSEISSSLIESTVTESVVEESPLIQSPLVESPITASIPNLDNFSNDLSTSTHAILPLPDLFSLPYFISESFLIAPTSRKSKVFSDFSARLLFTSTLSVLGLFFMFQTIVTNTGFENNLSRNALSSSGTASVISSSHLAIKNITSFFTSIPKLASSIFGKDSGIKNDQINNLANSNIAIDKSVDFNGIAVVPSTNSASEDEIIKDKIRDSFSDEIIIKPDDSGSAGIITPVFRESKGSDFIYVMVPVIDSKDKAN